MLSDKNKWLKPVFVSEMSKADYQCYTADDIVVSGTVGKGGI